MRLSLQGCLILWLCLLIPALAHSATPAPGMYASDYYPNASKPSELEAAQLWADGQCSYYEGVFSLTETSSNPETTTPGDSNVVGSYSAKCERSGYPLGYGNYTTRVWYTAPSECSSGQVYNPETSSCEQGPQEPEECYEAGQIYDASLKQCVLDCPNGQLNGVCLQDTADNTDDCNADSPDYKGFIGNGSTKQNLCTSNMECEGGAFGVVNGTPACIPDEYGPPTCDNQGVIVIDEYGFVCSDPEDQPEQPEIPEAPNTDTDGDGEPDEYQRENDPESVDKGLDKVREGISDTNSKIDGTNDRLDNVGKGISELNKNINEGLGKANNTLDDINQKMDGPSDGYSTEGKGTAPTFEETTNRFQTLLTQHPTIQAVTTIPTIAENNTCPVWTIPSTDYWSAMPLDTHCDILNSHRGLLSLLFIAAWTLAAIFVFLRA